MLVDISEQFLQFPNAVVLNAVGRKNTQMSAKERVRKRAQKGAKGRKRAKKGAKGCKRAQKQRFRVEIAINQV